MPWKLPAYCLSQVLDHFILGATAIEEGEGIYEHRWNYQDLLRVPVRVAQKESWLVLQRGGENIDVLSQSRKKISHKAILTCVLRFCISHLQ